MKQNIVPKSVPQIKKEDLLLKINKLYPNIKLPDIFFVGIRGYYEDTLGNPDVNDRGIFDDAIFIVTKDSFYSFNGNTDPSIYKHGIAKLKSGVYPVYKFDLHKGKYLALCQRAGKVTVIRDGKGEDIGNFGINIHHGGNYTTTSEGCQTIYMPQWNNFINTAQKEAKKVYGLDYRNKIYTYILLDN